MNFAPPPPSPRPRAIRNDKEAKQVVIDWANGERRAIGWERLRWACPCAACQGEFGVPGRLAKITALTAEETTLERLAGVGNYAVAALWADGHDTGIYPFTLLAALGADDSGPS